MKAQIRTTKNETKISKVINKQWRRGEGYLRSEWKNAEEGNESEKQKQKNTAEMEHDCCSGEERRA